MELLFISQLQGAYHSYQLFIHSFIHLCQVGGEAVAKATFSFDGKCTFRMRLYSAIVTSSCCCSLLFNSTAFRMISATHTKSNIDRTQAKDSMAWHYRTLLRDEIFGILNGFNKHTETRRHRHKQRLYASIIPHNFNANDMRSHWQSQSTHKKKRSQRTFASMYASCELKWLVTMFMCTEYTI